MDPALITLITTIISLLIKFIPDLEQIGKEIILLFNSGSNLTSEDLAKIQAFTDQLVATGHDLEAKILNDATQTAS